MYPASLSENVRALATRESLLDALFDGSAQALCLVDRQGEITRFNAAWANLFERAAPTVGASVTADVGASRPNFANELSIAQRDGRCALPLGEPPTNLWEGTISEVAVDGDSGPRWLIRGRVVATQSIDVEIADDWHNAGTHTNEIEALRAATESLDLGVLLIEFGETGRPSGFACNPAYVQITGAPLRLGRDGAEAGYQLYPPDRSAPLAHRDWPGPKAALQGVALRNHEVHLRRADGGWRILLVSATPLRIESDRSTRRVVIVMHDVTELRRAVENERESEARLRRMFENLNDGAMILDVIRDSRGVLIDARITEINEPLAQRMGSSREVALGKTFRELLPDRLPELLPRWTEVLDTGESWLAERSYKGRTGFARTYKINDTTLGLLAVDLHEIKEAERALRESEERFSTLFDHAADALFVHDARGDFLHVNQRGIELLGYTKDELLRLNVLDIEQTFDRASLESGWSDLSTVGPATFEGVHRRKDGTTFPVDVSISRTQWRGQPVFLASVRDITKRRIAEERLAAETQRLLVTLRSIGDGVIATDAHARVTLLNGVAEQLTGWSLAEAAGKPLHEVFTIIDERTGATTPNPVDRVLREGVVVALANHTLLVARDGTTHPIADSAAPIREATGEVGGVVLVFRDQTDERARDAMVGRSRSELMGLIEKLPIGVFVSRNGRVLYANPAIAKILGFSSPSEMVGIGPEDFIASEDLEAARSYVQPSSRPFNEMPGREWRGKRRDGGLVILASESNRQIEYDGEPATLWVVRDMTELRAVQAQLMQTDRLASVGMLAAGVAHEINNPLAYTIAALEYLSETLQRLAPSLPNADVTEAREALREAHEGATRVKLVVRDLKTFSRAEQELRTRVDVRALLESSIHMATNEIRHRAQLVRQFEDVPEVIANEARLGQVFLNLLINAAQSIPEGRAAANEIRVVTETDAQGRVVIEIRDSGEGIDSENLARIFDPFFSTKPMGVGTGLGLSICRNTVNALGGAISVESQRGKGSTFKVTLPAAARAETNVLDGSTSTRSQRGRRGKVLVIDDEPAVGLAIRRALRADHDVLTLTNANEAIDQIVHGEEPDAILCDLMMPEMSGWEFFAQLERIAPSLLSRVIFMTGGAFTPAAGAFLDTIETPRLEKPFDTTRLREVVRGVVGD